MEEIKYYKGYTQHLCNSVVRGNDEDPDAVLVMDMVPGLFVCTDTVQGGYCLPASKYINNLRSDFVQGVHVALEEPSAHPGYGYAEVKDRSITLANPMLKPKFIRGGIVLINNFMNSSKGRSGYSLFSGNYEKLLLDKSINVLWMYENKETKKQALLLKVNSPCTLTTELYDYAFSILEQHGKYLDFSASVH